MVPETFNSTSLVEASVLRVTLATSIAGLLATLGALLLGKLVIGPRIWFLVLGLAVGLSTIYSAVNIANISISVKFALSVMHILATLLVVLPLAEALKIRDSDLHRADVRYHEHLEAKDAATIIPATSGTTYTSTDTTIQPTDTTVIPIDAPSPDASSSSDGGSSAD
jgi:membrane protein implicated in regulation of membrane protease activity